MPLKLPERGREVLQFDFPIILSTFPNLRPDLCAVHRLIIR